MDDFNTYEYAAEQKSEGKWKLARILVLSAYVLFVAAYFLILYIIRLIPLFAITPIIVWMLVFFTWRYTKPDYRYFIEKGKFSFYTYYGKKTKRKNVLFNAGKKPYFFGWNEVAWVKILKFISLSFSFC